MTIHLKRAKYDVMVEALKGEIACGDQYYVKELPNSILLAVVDGLGHGEEAAFASKKALQTLDAHANESIETLFQLCNQALLDTRGAAMTIVRIDDKYHLSYVGIGNVQGVYWNIDESAKIKKDSFFLEGGIVGSRLPPFLHVKEVAMSPGDILILATDGIKIEFESETPKLALPEVIAKQLFETYRNIKDDGLVLVLQLL